MCGGPDGAVRRWGESDLAGGVDDLIERGVLRYVDATEVAAAEVALFPSDARCGATKKTLLEIHAHLMLGVTAALIPLLQANQSPRFGACAYDKND